MRSSSSSSNSSMWFLVLQTLTAATATAAVPMPALATGTTSTPTAGAGATNKAPPWSTAATTKVAPWSRRGPRSSSPGNATEDALRLLRRGQEQSEAQEEEEEEEEEAKYRLDDDDDKDDLLSSLYNEDALEARKYPKDDKTTTTATARPSAAFFSSSPPSSSFSSLEDWTRWEMDASVPSASASVVEDRRVRVARRLHYTYTSTLSAVFRGDVAPFVPPDVFGQTLEQELAAATAYSSLGSVKRRPPLAAAAAAAAAPLPPLCRDRTALHLLYGGAQYHRSLQYYTQLLLTTPLEPITQQEVAVLLGGRNEIHDGADVLRSVAVLCRCKMAPLLEQCLNEMQVGLEYVLRRFWDVVQYAVLIRPGTGARQEAETQEDEEDEAHVDAIRREISRAFHDFCTQRVRQASALCRQDCAALLRYVTWDMASASSSAFTHARRDAATFSTSHMEMRGGGGGRRRRGKVSRQGPRNKKHGMETTTTRTQAKVEDEAHAKKRNEWGLLKEDNVLVPEEHLARVLQSVHSSSFHKEEEEEEVRRAVESLVQWVTGKWRRELCNAIAAKYNSFCLLPLYSEFGAHLWQTLFSSSSSSNVVVSTTRTST